MEWKSVYLAVCWLVTTHCPALNAADTSLTLVPPGPSLTFSESETAILECRLNTGSNGGEGPTEVYWLKPNATQTSASNQTSTLTLKNLKLEDAGVYRCVAVGGNTTLEKNITINVTRRESHCGFESESLCGWTATSAAVGLSWKRLNGSDVVQGQLQTLHSDHTYGRTTQVGHFMQAVQLTSLGDDVALLTSSPRGPYKETKCLSVWYILQGNMMLVIELNVTNTSTTLATLQAGGDVCDVKSRDCWRQATVSVNCSQPDCQIILRAKAGASDAKKVRLSAVDDVTLSQGDCNVTTSAPAADGKQLTPVNLLTTSPTQPTSSPTKTTITTTISISSTAATTTTITPTTSVTSTATPSTRPTTTAAAQPPIPSSPPRSSSVPTSTASLRSANPVQTSPQTAPSLATGPTSTQAEQKPTNYVSATLAGESLSTLLPSDLIEVVDNGSNAGLAIGITLAVMAAGACTAAILYRRKHRGKKSTYITFGNPSYSREHLPANDFSLDSPLTLSSNGYTVLA